MKYYNLQADGEHRALADCYSAWALYRCLLEEFENKCNAANETDPDNPEEPAEM